MKVEQAGVVPIPAEEGGTPAPAEPAPASPPAPQEGDTPKPPASGEPTPTPAEGEAAPEADPSEKRVNDLMGKWRTEEHQHGETKTELQKYKDRFGDVNAQPSQGQAPPPQQGDTPSYRRDGWEPTTFAELQQALIEAETHGAKKALEGVAGQTTAKDEAKQAVDNFVFEVKTADPEFDEKAFFEYANRNGFPVNTVIDLRAVYRSHVELRNATKSAAQTAKDNKEGRAGDTVNKPGGGSTPQGSGVPYSKIRNAGSATDLVQDYISSQK
jgi:hypothetical protein